ncbi:MAG: putative DNA binding domain-containing protein [Alphaproteobacteria bacterium]|nr:putative DNA binding domain-containing protein [Alphaproteobacteria bacterium]
MNLGFESETIEFKESLSQLDKGIKSLSAMLNKQGYGYVYFGVCDNGDVKGIDVGKKSLQDVRNRIKDLISPQALVKIEECSDEQKKYIKVFVQGNDIPYSCDGRYYIRNVSSDEQASNEILRKMLANSEADIIRQIDSENQNLTFHQFFLILTNNSIHPKNTIEFYKSYGLINKLGKFNLMAYLLSDQNEIALKIVHFKGNDKSIMQERTDYSKQTLLQSVYEVLSYFKSICINKVELKEGKREEIPLFEFEAFREAWINACVHNNWAEKIPPSVYIFDDRIEVVSYGGLPYGLTLDGFFKGTSIPVNKGLLTIFIANRFAEQSVHGVPIIVSKYGKTSFEFNDGILKVIIPFAFERESVKVRKNLEKAQSKLTKNQKDVYECLKKNQKIKLIDVSKELGLSLAGVKKIVQKLQQLEMIEHTGSKKDGLWKTVDFKSLL